MREPILCMRGSDSTKRRPKAGNSGEAWATRRKKIIAILLIENCPDRRAKAFAG